MSRLSEEQTVDRLPIHAGSDEETRPVRSEVAHEAAERLLAPARIVNGELAGDDVER